MWQLLISQMEVVIREGFIYLPLLFDAQIEAEVGRLSRGTADAGPEGAQINPFLFRIDGRYFIKSLSLNSLIENYPSAFPEEYEKRRLQLRQQFLPEFLTYRPPLDPRLKTILFEILPHFWRLRRSRRRGANGMAAVLAYLAASLPKTEASGYVDELRERQELFQQAITRLGSPGKPKPEPPGEFQGPAGELFGWFEDILQWKLVRQEIRRWQGELDRVEDLLNLPEAELTVLLSVAAQGMIEVDGFGCCPDRKHAGEYLIYLRTGEYVLQDYFGRLYLFPDCRVSISTAGPMYPMVLDTYKHPLLRRYEEGQQICLTDFQPALEFSAGAAIRSLEEGVNALFYGYNSRKRNGYNSLDRFGRHQSVVHFDDWRIDQDDARIGRSELEVKNRNI